MLSNDQLLSLIASWKQEHGEEINTRFCVPVDRKARMYMYCILIQTLKDEYGYEEQHFRYQTTTAVIDASINPRSEKKKEWKEAALADWNDAIAGYFPKKFSEVDPDKLPGKRNKFKRPEIADDTPVELEKPVDDSIYEGLPPVKTVVDEEFLKMLEGVGEDE